MSGWTNANKFSGNTQKTPRLDELIHMPKLPKNETKLYRLMGPAHLVAEYWFEVFTKKGESTARIRKLATNFDSSTGEFKGECPYAELLGIRPRVIAFANAINREVQENAPRKTGKLNKSEKEYHTFGSGEDKIKLHIKEKGSEIFTPVQALRFPSSAATKVSDTSTTNKVKNKKTGETTQYGPEHPKHGYDLAIKWNPDAKTPSDQYFIQKEGRTPLTEEELEYPVQNIWLEKAETPEQARQEAEKFLKMGLVERDEKGKNILNSPPSGGGGKGKGDKKGKKPDYLGGLDDDDKKDKKKKKDKGGKADKADDKSDKKGKKDKSGKADKSEKSDKKDKSKDKSDKAADKGGKKDKGKKAKGKGGSNKLDLD